MDEILTAIRRATTDMDVESAPRVVGVSVVPPEHPVVDEPPVPVSIDPASPQVPPSAPLSARQAQGAASPTSDEETKQAADRNAATALGRGPEAGLLSRETNAAVGSAFSTLAHAVRKQNSQTLEDLVRETLYPPADILAGRQFARLGRTHGTDGNRADRARALTTTPSNALMSNVPGLSNQCPQAQAKAKKILRARNLRSAPSTLL